jgi:hypothetical protein
MAFERLRVSEPNSTQCTHQFSGVSIGFQRGHFLRDQRSVNLLFVDPEFCQRFERFVAARASYYHSFRLPTFNPLFLAGWG